MKLCSEEIGIENELITTMFVAGLNSTLKSLVCMSKPTTLAAAYEFAVTVETAHLDINKKKTVIFAEVEKPVTSPAHSPSPALPTNPPPTQTTEMPAKYCVACERDGYDISEYCTLHAFKEERCQ